MSLEDYRRKLEHQLNDNVMPFWIEKTVDTEFGGCLHQLDRDGSVISPNKGMWVHGRFLWLLCWLCRTRGLNDDFLVTARRISDFIRSYARDSDGRWWYELSRDGRPRRKRRYLFTEVFISLGLTAWAALEPAVNSGRDSDPGARCEDSPWRSPIKAGLRLQRPAPIWPAGSIIASRCRPSTHPACPRCAAIPM